MLFLIAGWLHFAGLSNLIRYQTFRAGAALITALLVAMAIGPRFISMLRVRQGKGQPIRADGPQSHLAKRGTPTMGGLMILIALVVAMLLWMDLTDPFVWACMAVTIGFGMIGFMDDYDKVTKYSHRGLPGRARLGLEFVVAGVAAWIIVRHISTNLYIPFLPRTFIPLGWLYYPFAAVVIVGAGNAVNLTDGLDGLATMPVIIAAGAFAIISYLTGRPDYTHYLGIPHVRNAGELAILCTGIMGAGLGFCGSTRRPPPCSWATPAAWRWAERSARSPWRRITRSCWRLSAACSCWRRPRSSSRCSFISAPAGACSAWRRSTTISNNWAGPNRPW